MTEEMISKEKWEGVLTIMGYGFHDQVRFLEVSQKLAVWSQISGSKEEQLSLAIVEEFLQNYGVDLARFRSLLFDLYRRE